jgi:hypothetical protein
VFNVNAVVNWIETHRETVEISKWAALVLVAWLTGLFRFIRSRTRKPQVRIIEPSSRCLIERFADKNAVRATFLVEIEVLNRSAEEIVVRSLNLRARRPNPVRRWVPKISAVSLPSRVYHPTGSGLKVMRNWFTRFQDEWPESTLEGIIAPRHLQSGYAMFVSFTYGDFNPLIVDGTVAVLIEVGLTTGRARARGKVTITENTAFFEEMVPGVLAQIARPNSWNLPLRY